MLFQALITLPFLPSVSFTLLLASNAPLARAAASLSSSKRGLAYHGDDHVGDNNLLLTGNSSVSWYYTWSLWPARTVPSSPDSVAFIPLVHGLSDAADPNLVSLLERLPQSATRLLTFNEPDGDTGSGGSAISASDAAASYIRYILPLRNGSAPSASNRNAGRTWLVSHPVVTGSGRGLDWLADFNASCHKLNPGVGCPCDFVAAHWYGDFPGLAGWLGTLHDFYSTPSVGGGGAGGAAGRMWVTEMALPQGSDGATLAMMNSSLPYLDGLDYVQGYAWFGAFRSDESNAWTGDNVALFDDDGGLTELGALYLGGDGRGYRVGMTGGAAGRPAPPLPLPLPGVGTTRGLGSGGSVWAMFVFLIAMLVAVG